MQNGFGVAALVLGIAAVVLCWSVVGGVVLGGLALLFGILGRKRVSRLEADNGGMALAGVILGVVGLVAGVAFGILYGVLLARGDYGSYADCTNAAQTQADQNRCDREFQDGFTR